MKSDLTAFEPPVILERPALWSRALVWLIIGVTTSGIAWAAFAKIEQSVPATGKLEPQTSVVEIKAPTEGVVRKIYVEDGQRVTTGQLLLNFDPTAPEADLESLNKVRNSLAQENRVLATGKSTDPLMRSLLKLRDSLERENQVFAAQYTGQAPGGTKAGFDVDKQLMAASAAEAKSRLSAARQQIAELRQQQAQAESGLQSTRKALAIRQNRLEIIKPLAVQGAIPKVHVEDKQAEVLEQQKEVGQLTLEKQRLAASIKKSEADLSTTAAVSNKEQLSKISENQKRIAEIDTQISEKQLENQKRIAEIDGQLAKAKLTRQYQELRAPRDGVVFDLQPNSSGFVASASEPILKVVPSGGLVASVFITNKDIGFVKQGMPVDVKLESFPQSEFGSLEGKLSSIGSDALPPTQERPFYAFPATIAIDEKSLISDGKPLPLQSGMAVNASIKVRKRTVMSLFTGMFDDKVKSLESVR